MKNQANPEYKYFVFNTEDQIIVAGNEYKEDAEDVCDELNDLYYSPLYRVYTASYLQTRKQINPHDFNNWANPITKESN